RVVAVDRIIEIRIEAAKHVLRVGASKAVEQTAQFPLRRVGLSRHQIAPVELGLQIKGQAPVRKDVVFIPPLDRQRTSRAADGALGQGKIGDADAEEMPAGDVHLKLTALFPAVVMLNGDVEDMTS